MRLIDADALLKRINYKAESGMGKTIAFAFKHFIDDAPTIESHGDLISRADAIAYIARVTNSGLGRNKSLEYIRKYIVALPSANAEPMTEEVREALMRLTMCAREECAMCKYKDECDFDFQYKISTDNMNTLSDALMRSRCEVDAKSAEAVQGEWRTGKPKENGEYMVTLDAWGHRYINIMYYAEPQMPNREVDGVCWYRSDDEWGDVVYDDKDILAWQPLPTPYKGGDSE